MLRRHKPIVTTIIVIKTIRWTKWIGLVIVNDHHNTHVEADQASWDSPMDHPVDQSDFEKLGEQPQNLALDHMKQVWRIPCPYTTA